MEYDGWKRLLDERDEKARRESEEGAARLRRWWYRVMFVVLLVLISPAVALCAVTSLAYLFMALTMLFRLHA